MAAPAAAAPGMAATPGIAAATLPPKLPDALQVLEFAAARAPEVAAIEAALGASGLDLSAAAQLPRHLRRRTTSHNSRKTPVRRRQRLAAAATDAEGGAPPAKRQRVPANRGQRRQLKALRAERERPASDAAATPTAAADTKPFWLETHVWHTKRMHMAQRWGYLLPSNRNDLGVRAAHRAAATATALHDRSYAPPLRLRAAAPPGGAGGQAAAVLLRELLVRCGCELPAEGGDTGGAPGRLQLQRFLLRWPADSASAGAVIAPAEWLSLPPGCDDAAAAALWLWVPPEATAEARRCLSAAASSLSGSRLAVDTADAPLAFNRFELSGSGATQAVGAIIQGGADALTEQAAQEGQVVAVRFAPERPSSSETDPLSEKDPAANKPPSSTDVLRLLGGSPASSSSPPPLGGALAIRRPGLFSKGRPSWELLVPQGNGMSIWQRLILGEARAMGVIERDHIRFEAGLPCFPRDYPDASASYKVWAVETNEDAADVEAGLPPPRRRSHVAAEALSGDGDKSVIGAPVWSRVASDAAAGQDEAQQHVVVLRGSGAATEVCALNALLFNNGDGGGGKDRSKRRRRQRRRKARLLAAEAEGDAAEGTADLLVSPPAPSGETAAVSSGAGDDGQLQLLPVQVQPLGRGAFSRGATELCMPTDADLTAWRKGKGKGNANQWDGVLVEPPPPKLKLPSSGGPAEGKADGEADDEVRRDVVGFVTSGGYSWERGRPSGLGFASVAALRELFGKAVPCSSLVGLCHTPPTAAASESDASRPTAFVLVRDLRSLRFRPASLMLLQASTTAASNEWQ